MSVGPSKALGDLLARSRVVDARIVVLIEVQAPPRECRQEQLLKNETLQQGLPLLFTDLVDHIEEGVQKRRLMKTFDSIQRIDQPPHQGGAGTSPPTDENGLLRLAGHFVEH